MHPIRLTFDNGPHREIGIANTNRRAKLDAKPGEKASLDRSPPVRKRIGKCAIRRVQCHGPVKWISVVHDLQSDHYTAIITSISHAVGADDIAALGISWNQALKDVVVHRTVGALDLEIAAEQSRRVLFQSLHNAGIDNADSSNRGNTKGQAGKKDQRSHKSAPELTPSHAPGKAEIGDHATSSVRSGFIVAC